MTRQFSKGDRVVKGSEVGVVVELKNRTTGKPFLMVWIHNGPRKNQREYPERGWEVEETANHEDRPDYDDDSVTTTENKAVRMWRTRVRR